MHTDLEKNIDTYIKERLDQYRSWYDNKAVSTKKKYLQGRIWSAVGAVFVPILTNISLPVLHITDGFTVDPIKVIITIVSTTVALLIALEGVLHYREQWKNYRTTEQYLTAQKNLFCNNVGDYSGHSRATGFKLLVDRVEKAIVDENAITLNVLTKVDNAGKSSD